jgi:hypothetical protein
MTRQLLAMFVVCLAMSTTAEARSPVRGLGPQAGSVTVCSRYGNGCYAAPLRQGRFGLEMRLKGGTWIDCKGSCKDTLREETVDFWDTQRERNPRH